MKKFTHLTLKERYQIFAYIKVGYTIKKLLSHLSVEWGGEDY